MTWREATIGAGLGLTICIELGSSSIILTSKFAMRLSTYCPLLSQAPESKPPINGADRPLYLHT